MGTPIPAWVHRLVYSARSRAIQAHVPFDFRPEDIIRMWDEQQGLCYWFHVPMFVSGDVPRHPLLPSLDRANPTRGYVEGNVILCCWAANAAKGSTDPLLWEEFLDNLREGMKLRK